jgi:hypothetical protein
MRLEMPYNMAPLYTVSLTPVQLYAGSQMLQETRCCDAESLALTQPRMGCNDLNKQV